MDAAGAPPAAPRATDGATDRATIVNDGARAVTVILAPASREHLLLPGEAVVVEAEGPPGSGAGLLVERACDVAVAWGWPGADLRLLAPDGRVLLGWAEPPAPVPPPAP